MKFLLLSVALGAPLLIRGEPILPILTDDELSQFGTGQTLPPTVLPVRPVVPTQAPITPFPTEGTEPPATETPTVSPTVEKAPSPSPPDDDMMSMSYAMSLDYHHSDGGAGSMDYAAIVPCMTFGKSGKACGKTGKASKVGKTESKDDGQTGYYGDDWYGKSEDGGHDMDDEGYQTDDAYGSGNGDGGVKSDDGYLEHDADKSDDGYGDGGDGGNKGDDGYSGSGSGSGGGKSDDEYAMPDDGYGDSGSGSGGGSGEDKPDDELSMSYESNSVDGNGGGKSDDGYAEHDDGYSTDDHYNSGGNGHDSTSPKPKADKPKAKTAKDSVSKFGKSTHGKSGKSGGGKSGKGGKATHSHIKPHKPSKTSKPNHSHSQYPDHGYSYDYYRAYNAEEVRRLRGQVARVVKEMGFDVANTNHPEDQGQRRVGITHRNGRRQRKLPHKGSKTDSPTFFPTASPTMGKSSKDLPGKYDTDVPTPSPTLELEKEDDAVVYLDDYTLVDDYEFASISMSLSYGDEISQDDAIVYLDDDVIVNLDDDAFVEDDALVEDDDGVDNANGVENGGINVEVDHDGDGDVTVNINVNSGSSWSETHSTMAPLDDDYEEDTATSTPPAGNDDYKDDIDSTLYPTDVPEENGYAVTSTLPATTEYGGDDAIVYLDDYAVATTAFPTTTEYGAVSLTTAFADDGYEALEPDHGSETYEDDYTALTYDDEYDPLVDDEYDPTAAEDEYELYDDSKTEDYTVRRRAESNRMIRSGVKTDNRKT